MGLAEKRALQEFKDKKFPDLKKEIDAAAGFNVSMDVKWDTLAVEGKADQYSEAFEKVYFVPLRDAFKSITADKLGKDALKAKLKKVVIGNTKANVYATEFTFEGGTLDIDYESCSWVDSVSDRTDGIRALLEKNL